MPRNSYFDPIARTRVEQEVRVFQAGLKWHSLERLHPLPRSYILVRTADGRVLSAAYYPDLGWYFGPFGDTGTPVMWAELGPGHSTSQ